MSIEDVGSLLLDAALESGGVIVEGVPPARSHRLGEALCGAACACSTDLFLVGPTATAATVLQFIESLRIDGLPAHPPHGIAHVSHGDGSGLVTLWIEDLPRLLAAAGGEDLDVALGGACFGDCDSQLTVTAVAACIGPELPRDPLSMALSERSERVHLARLLMDCGLSAGHYWLCLDLDRSDQRDWVRAASIAVQTGGPVLARLERLSANERLSFRSGADEPLFIFTGEEGDSSELTIPDTYRQFAPILARTTRPESCRGAVERADWLASRVAPGGDVYWVDRYLASMDSSLLGRFLARFCAVVGNSTDVILVAGRPPGRDDQVRELGTRLRQVIGEHSRLRLLIMDRDGWNFFHDRHLYMPQAGQILNLGTCDRVTGQYGLDNFVSTPLVNDRRACRMAVSIIAAHTQPFLP